MSNSNYELPRILYKYIKTKHAAAFIQDGDLQIGTLYYYRSIEKNGIGDPDEGKKETYLANTDIDSRNMNIQQKEFISKFIQLDETSVFTADSSTKFRFHENSPDYYIFCTSEEYSKELMLEFDCDACIKINNLELFFGMITECLLKRGLIRPEWYLVKCQYIERSQNYLQADKIPPEVIKAPCFKKQMEWRAMWIPLKSEINPVIIKCRKARELSNLM